MPQVILVREGRCGITVHPYRQSLSTVTMSKVSGSAPSSLPRNAHALVSALANSACLNAVWKSAIASSYCSLWSRMHVCMCKALNGLGWRSTPLRKLNLSTPYLPLNRHLAPLSVHNTQTLIESDVHHSPGSSPHTNISRLRMYTGSNALVCTCVACALAGSSENT